MLKSVNPFDGKVIETYAADSASHVESELDRLSGYRPGSIASRLSLLRRLEDQLLARKEELATMAALEMGKPIVQGRLEVEKCARVCAYYAERSEEWLRDRSVSGAGQRAAVSLRPLGTLLAIMPWNFPYWQVFRVLAPQIALGNAVVLKHASNVTGCATLIDEMVQAAAQGEPVFSFLKLGHQGVLPLIGDRRIHAVTLTGSARAGQSVGAEAGRFIKKSVLELGGSDPYIVLEDADLKKAISACVRSRTNNSGQSCIAAKRFIVHRDVVKDFTEGFVGELARLSVGDPSENSTQIGPLSKESGLKEIKEQLQRSLGQVDVVWEGQTPDQGYFFAPTVVQVKDAECAVFQEETFAPLAAVLSVESEREALEAARRSQFGLGGAVFTEDLERGWRIAREELPVGTSAVNTFVQSYPELPFGGVSGSGYGRELGKTALTEFANIKSIVLNG